MTIRNNFDRLSTGVNIEFRGCHDIGIAQLDFRDNFVSLADDKFYYVDNGNVTDHGDIEFTLSGLKKDMLRFQKENIDRDSEKISKAELSESIMDYFDGITLQAMAEINAELAEYNLKIVPDREINSIVTKGYCQGDYAEVFYSPSDIAKEWGRRPDEKGLSDRFHNLFWDCPINATVTIDGEDFFYDEFFNVYNWERDKWIDHLVGNSIATREQLDGVIPETLDHG